MAGQKIQKKKLFFWRGNDEPVAVELAPPLFVWFGTTAAVSSLPDIGTGGSENRDNYGSSLVSYLAAYLASTLQYTCCFPSIFCAGAFCVRSLVCGRLTGKLTVWGLIVADLQDIR